MHLEAIFEQLNEAYLICQRGKAESVYLNPTACQLLTTSQAEFATTDLWQTQLASLLVTDGEAKSEQRFSHGGRIFTVKPSAIEHGNQHYILGHISLAVPSADTLHNFFNLVDNLGAYVYCKDLDYNYTYANQQVCDLFGHSIEEIIGNNDCMFFGEETGTNLVEQVDRFVIEQGKTQENEEINYVPQFDEYRHYLSVKKPLLDDNGNICGLFGISTDITEQKRIQQQLRESEQKLCTILDNVGAYIFIKDKERRFQYINKMTEQLFQRKSAEIVGMNNFDLLGPEQGEEFDRTDREVFERGEKLSCIESFDAGGHTYYYWTVKIPLRNESGEIDRYIGISTDITEQKNLEHQAQQANEQLQQRIEEISLLKDKLQQQATHDALTGLYNRRFLEEHCELSFTDPDRGPTSLLMVDVDHFKQINDQLGHRKGDQVLQLLAQVMQRECRNNDLICRYGGEEFLILLPQTNTQTAFKKAEWIRKQYQISVSQQHPDIKHSSISIGIAGSPENGHDFEQVCHAADQALYQAKQQGRNRCVSAQ